MSLPLLAVDPARADTQGTPAPEQEAPGPEQDAPLPPGESPRPQPNYGGREAEETDVGEALLWVPRVVLFPAYVVTEYGIRRPVGAIATAAERHRLKARWDEFFTFDKEQKVGLFPTGSIDLGFRPTAGFYFFWNDFSGGSDFKLRVTTGGIEKWTIDALWRLPVGRHEEVRLTVDYSLRPDASFYGLGAAVQDEAFRYEASRLDLRATYRRSSGRWAYWSYAGLLSAEFDPEEGDLGDRALGEAIEEGLIEAPPGLEGGILAAYTGLVARVDTRPPRVGPPPRSAQDLEHESGTGVAARVHVEHNAGLRGTRATVEQVARLPNWIHYGASALASLDITGTRRTLELEGVVVFTEGLPSDNPIPFTEQVALGGNYPLRAFRSGRLIDRSAAVATLKYRWPIWVVLDGTLHYAVGDVFGARLSGFAPERLRSSFGIGIESVSSLDHPFEILLAWGTKPFGEGGAIDTFRFVAGSRAHF